MCNEVPLHILGLLEQRHLAIPSSSSILPSLDTFFVAGDGTGLCTLLLLPLLVLLLLLLPCVLSQLALTVNLTKPRIPWGEAQSSIMSVSAWPVGISVRDGLDDQLM